MPPWAQLTGGLVNSIHFVAHITLRARQSRSVSNRCSNARFRTLALPIVALSGNDNAI